MLANVFEYIRMTKGVRSPQVEGEEIGEPPLTGIQISFLDRSINATTQIMYDTRMSFQLCAFYDEDIFISTTVISMCFGDTISATLYSYLNVIYEREFELPRDA